MLLAELAIAGRALAACADHGHKRGDSQRVDPNAFPTNYKVDLIGLVRTSVGDPTNIRNAYISEPTLKISGTENRFVVCVRFNAKGSDGRYCQSAFRRCPPQLPRSDHLEHELKLEAPLVARAACGTDSPCQHVSSCGSYWG
jgi:hypothetical protein